MDTLLEEVKLMIRSGYPFVYLVTHEEERIIRYLKRLVGNNDSRITLWSQTMGFHTDIYQDKIISDITDPICALEYVNNHAPQHIFVFKDFHFHLLNQLVIRRLRDLEQILESQQKNIIFVSPKLVIPKELEKDITVMDVPLPKVSEVSKIFVSLLKSKGISIQSDLFEKYVKTSLGLTEKEIRKVYAKFVATQSTFSEDDLDMLISEKKSILRKNEFLEYIDLFVTIEDIGGLNQLKEWLKERSLAFTERARQYGLPQPKGVFLLGVQGCGKSLTAKTVAKLWQLPLLRLDLASMLSRSSDSLENNLRETIRIAESMSPVVLWIDEIEKAFAGKDSNGGTLRTFGAMLTWLQEKTMPVFVIATANDVQNLPPELLRKGRFDEIFFVDLPSTHERAEILSIHLKKRGRMPENFNLYSVSEATDKYSGAELEQLVISSLFYSFSRNRELTTQDLIRQARESVPLAVTMSEHIKALKEWARTRTRPAAHDRKRINFFEAWESSANN